VGVRPILAVALLVAALAVILAALVVSEPGMPTPAVAPSTIGTPAGKGFERG
jgi:hypothetical protein